MVMSEIMYNTAVISLLIYAIVTAYAFYAFEGDAE
jgi:hypothetical protein